MAVQTFLFGKVKFSIVSPEWEMSSDGLMQVPTKPGLGVDIDHDRIESLCVHKEVMDA